MLYCYKKCKIKYNQSNHNAGELPLLIPQQLNTISNDSENDMKKDPNEPQDTSSLNVCESTSGKNHFNLHV